MIEFGDGIKELLQVLSDPCATWPEPHACDTDISRDTSTSDSEFPKNDHQESPTDICLTFEDKPLEEVSSCELHRLLDEIKTIFNQSIPESTVPSGEMSMTSKLPP